MINLILSGANGKMGQVVASLAKNDPAFKIRAGFDINNIETDTFPVYADPSEYTGEADCIIDFSHPNAFDALLDYALKRRLPVVFATTGLSDAQINRIHEAAKTIPVFYSANMSFGVNLLIDLVTRAESLLKDDFDVEIVEKHHHRKVDAPSGTALAIADAIKENSDKDYEYVYDRHAVSHKRSPNEIGIQSVRGGTIVGEHSVIFAGNDEIIEINHTALSRDIFASGALRAAKFISDRPAGFYNMKSILK